MEKSTSTGPYAMEDFPTDDDIAKITREAMDGSVQSAILLQLIRIERSMGQISSVLQDLVDARA